MSKDNRYDIEELLKLYDKKSLVETALLNIDMDIIKSRALLDTDFNNTKYGNVHYNVSGHSYTDTKKLYDEVYFHVYKDSERVRVNVYNIARVMKDLMLFERVDNDYISFTLSYTNNNYDFVLEVSVNFNDSDDSGDFLIIKAITKNDKEIIELINYNTNVTNYKEIYGDEKAAIDLLDKEVMVHVN